MDKQTVTIPKEFKARLFVYAAAASFTGSAMLLLLQTLQVFMEQGGWQMMAAWAVVAASWANLSFLLVRRFIARAFGYRWYPTMIPVLLCLPVLVFLVIQEDAFLETTAWFILPIVALSAAGGYLLGQKAGDLKREEILAGAKP